MHESVRSWRIWVRSNGVVWFAEVLFKDSRSNKILDMFSVIHHLEYGLDSLSYKGNTIKSLKHLAWDTDDCPENALFHWIRVIFTDRCISVPKSLSNLSYPACCLCNVVVCEEIPCSSQEWSMRTINGAPGLTRHWIDNNSGCCSFTQPLSAFIKRLLDDTEMTEVPYGYSFP